MADHDLTDPSNDGDSKAVLALSIAAFGSGMSQRIADPMLPRLASDFDLTLGMASWVITAFTISYALCQLFFGPIGDRYGKYRVVTWTCIASTIASLLCALAPDLPLLLVARVLAGGTVSAIIPLSMAWIGDVVPYQRRQPVLARFLIGHILGVSAGQLLGGMSADYFGWRVPFVVITLLFMGGAWFLLSVGRELPAFAQATQRSDGHVLQNMWREFALVCSRRWARVVLATTFTEGAVVFGALAFIVAHLHHVLAISLTAAGAIAMLFGFGGFLYASASRWLVPHFGETGLATGGTLIMLASLTMVGLASSAWLAAPACFSIGFGFYMLHNTLQINATQMAPERRGAAVSAFAACFFSGQSFGVAITGWLVGRIGTPRVMLLAALGVSILGFNFVREQRLHLK